ncbi:MAG TPA: GNAT family N-acetyltransferase, partial [Actinomycetota bacterium]
LLADVGGLLAPPGPVVRPATPPDQAAAARLLETGPGGQAAVTGRPPGAETGQPLRVVAIDEERVVGAAAVRPAGTIGLLDGPVVEEAWRGRLVGTRLAAAACIQARAAGLGRVAAPASAEGFLGRLGFRSAPDHDPPLVRELGDG